MTMTDDIIAVDDIRRSIIRQVSAEQGASQHYVCLSTTDWDIVLGQLSATPPEPVSGDVEARAREYSDEALTTHAIDFLDRKANEWLSETGVARMVQSAAAVFEGRADLATLQRFNETLEAIMHQTFVEGAFRAWTEIAAEGRSTALAEAEAAKALRDVAQAERMEAITAFDRTLDRAIAAEAEAEAMRALCKANNDLARMNAEHRDEWRTKAVLAMEALEQIDNLRPATCDMTLAHEMADIATAALSRGGEAGDGSARR